ncbi:MAG TPA: glycosyltransferase family 4 protein [Pyrinomonadaceae bacterium]|nr:glycosyltransferase family 4 protein [Pyrinomonadaceae bacterium]
MRVLQICSARSIGGGERHVIDLSNRMTERGHEVFLAVVPGSPLIAQLDNSISDRIFTLPLRNALDISSAIRIARHVRSHKIGLLNAHLARDYPITAAAAQLAKVPFVITRHVLFPMSRLHRLILRKASFVIAPSNAVAANLRREAIFPDEKIVTIRYGLDVDRFEASQRNSDPFLRVGAIGNLDPVKGFDTLIHAAKIVHAENPSARFEIIGEDRSQTGENRKALEELIGRLELAEVVRLSGWSDDIGKKLAGFDLFVSSSRSESFGFVIAEAMLSGLPVIATETEGAKEIISDLPLGMLVPIASPEAMARAINDLLNDEMKRRQLAKFGRQHVEEHFSLGRMVEQTEKLYESVLRP